MRFLKAWLPVILLQLLIFGVSSRSLHGVGFSVHHLDKVAHFGEYAVVAALLYRALRLSGGQRSETTWLTLALIAGLAFGDEKLQSYVPGRDSNVLDWFADLAGGSAGIFWKRVREE